MASDL